MMDPRPSSSNWDQPVYQLAKASGVFFTVHIENNPDESVLASLTGVDFEAGLGNMALFSIRVIIQSLQS